MTLYAIGDIQGCDAAFGRLLDKLHFSAAKDRLWLVGDLVNRGPDSLGVLRRVMSFDDRVDCVLGNHDLHLLAVAAGIRRLYRGDTFKDVLRAKDSKKLVNWLRHRPLLVHDAAENRALVHAGIPPVWSIKKAVKNAAIVESQLRGRAWKDALSHMYGNLPRVWSRKLDRVQRIRYTINALTRMRFCDAKGHLAFGHTGPPGTQPKRYMPWFEVPGRKATDTHIFFGHWSALGLFEGHNVTGLDSGCVWGRKLTAVALKPRGIKRTRVKCWH
jgi:bis(5'-nucleosyl)-tetraphosphatase (symmetrical)